MTNEQNITILILKRNSATRDVDLETKKEYVVSSIIQAAKECDEQKGKEGVKRRRRTIMFVISPFIYLIYNLLRHCI